ncbi:hypothetical protein ASE17_19960 [Phenylobacterium sp. Root77]|uniref:hybrid sensor histidine kinase/response regulator n=1 Tax=unclassified Phenylobacterium TaxID=2640670 RepID=UPI0006FA4DC8|nr:MULTISPECIES: PAS domain-containing protein [unclassified Phenylobacterium]KQW66961.1 hypothetical protein ASC73_17645 [Phenylobacterium sp. Root1277]KQW89654.1 hypothetical protein ASC79_18550 [Phenylobacterium sp. Root1290]KRC43477.1 hypothetical protein ASE17_19960 [Phenylobacterium sp. Root77]
MTDDRHAAIPSQIRKALEALPAPALETLSGAWCWDVGAKRLHADGRFAQLCNLAPESAAAGVPTSSFFAAIHPDDVMRIKIAVAGVMHGSELFAKEYRVGEARTGYRWVSARGAAERDADQHVLRFSGVLTDITEQKRVQEQLRIAQTAGGVGTFGYTSGFGTVEVSDQFCRLLGLSPTDALPVRTVNGAVIQGGEIIETGRRELGGLEQAEFLIVRPDTGEHRWIARRGEVVRDDFSDGERMVGVIHDVTEFKRVEAELRRLTAALEDRVDARTRERDQVWNLSKDLLFVAGRNGKFRAINPAWEKVLGFSSEELVGAPVHALIHLDDLPAMHERMARAARGESIGEFECQVRSRDGAFRWFSWTTTPAGDAIHATGRDITARKALEDQLRQSQKMEAVGQLTGGLAHDFNNMLTGVLGGIDMVRRRLRDGRMQDVERFLEAASTSGQRAAALTHRLLAFSRRQSLHSAPVDVEALASSMADLLRRTLGEQIRLELEMTPQLPMALADANQLESAILNLAINARDAMPSGGVLTIRARALTLDDAELQRSDHATAGDYVEISVADTGGGISREVLGKVFDPFFTTKPIGQGTGLGLSMIYGFVQQSHGHVRVESHVGQGTIFRLYLPVHVGETQVAIDEAQPAPGGAGQSVLVIEDDASVRLLVVQVLEELGYRPLETTGSREALPLLQSDAPIDLLITDVGLPGLNGRQLAEIARERRPQLPVLFMTAYAEPALDQNQFLDEGMAIISKPFGIDQLAQRIALMFGR